MTDEELAHLRRWKAEASEVMMGLQDLGKALEIPPGERITGPLALKYVEHLKKTIEDAKAACRPNGGVPAYVIVDDVLEILERKS